MEKYLYSPTTFTTKCANIFVIFLLISGKTVSIKFGELKHGCILVKLNLFDIIEKNLIQRSYSIARA